MLVYYVPDKHHLFNETKLKTAFAVLVLRSLIRWASSLLNILQQNAYQIIINII